MVNIWNKDIENIMIRSYSEALAETVGSIMLLAYNRGRNVHPVNFNKEICIRYNLSPFPILMENFLPEIIHDISNVKDFFRKGDHNNRYVRNYKYSHCSASFGNRKSKNLEKCHVPPSFYD